MSTLLPQSTNYINKSSLKPNGFTFKHFFVGHDKSPMRITTDSVLLGAWAPIAPLPDHVLDIGTGCGVIALMLAQRLADYEHVTIDAIDIDSNAVLQCQENICNSPFNNISAHLQDIKSVLSITNYHQPSLSKYYDLIVCNPPYFKTAVACRSEQRQTARYTEQLSHKQLFECVDFLLSNTGRFCVVLPYHLCSEFEQLGLQLQLFLSQQVNISYNEDSDYSLVLCCFSRDTKPCIIKELCMRNNDKSYTKEFMELLKDFYLRF